MSVKLRRLIVLSLIVCGGVMLSLGYAWLVHVGLGIPCLFNRVTGLQCPGCGLSRAVAALLAGQLNDFIAHNPLAPVILLYFLWLGAFTAKRYVQTGKFAYTTPCKWVDVTVLAVLLIWWVARNLLPV